MRFKVSIVLGLLLTFFLTLNARATLLSTPGSLSQETLSESVPTGIAPAAWSTSDFQVEWLGSQIEGLEISLVPESIQWVRVMDVLVLPRALLRISSADQNGSGYVQSGLTSKPLTLPLTEMAIPLFSHSEYATKIEIKRNGKIEHGKIRIRFSPRTEFEKKKNIFLDPSCSRFQIVMDPQQTDSNEWIYIGCRSVITEGQVNPRTTLELYLYWDLPAEGIEVNEVPVPPILPSLWTFRLDSKTKALKLKGAMHQLTLKLNLPERFHYGSFGLGLGPYHYHFIGDQTEISQMAPVLTLYGTYFITETIRLVAFDATALASHGYTDLGFYISLENFRFLDRRFSVNIMLGAHAIAFQTVGQTHFRPGAPQGLEMIYTDAFLPGHNLIFGGFVYPKIDDKSYVNLWARWGSSTFLEFNYILWEEAVGSQILYSRSMGLTLGFPIGKAL